jgi:aminoglycoside/choline kinase family phosphotransferase
MVPAEKLIQQYLKTDQYTITRLKGDGSDRGIFRVVSNLTSIILIQSVNIDENKNFIYLTKVLEEKGIPVPKIYAINDDFSCYLLEDLGNNTLADLLYSKKAEDESFKIEAYRKVVRYLIEIQNKLKDLSSSGIQYKQMDFDLYHSDLKYFKTEFLKQFHFQSKISTSIQSEFNQMLNALITVDHNYFVYRDFQSRNFMWVDNSPVFIDYQAAMMGSLYYDLGSLLYSSRSGLSQQERDLIIQFYYEKKQLQIPFQDFLSHLYRFILLRRLRSLGSYGLLSRKGKSHFAGYIPQALEELVILFDLGDLTSFKHIRKMMVAIQKEWGSKTI